MARNIPRSAGGLLSYFTRHRTAANLLLVLLLVLGVAAMPNMRTQFFPDVVSNNINVNVVWEGAGPEDVDSAIIQALDPALLSVEGVENTYAVSHEGWGQVTVQFEPGWDSGRAVEDIQSVIDGISTLPDEAEEPTIQRAVWRDRVTDVVISGPLDAQQLAQLADELVARLFASGVTRTTLRGVAAPNTLIEVPSSRLVGYDVTMSEIAAAVRAEVSANPAGDVEGANARVRAGSEKRAPEDLAAIVLRSNPDGSTLTIGDVAAIRVEGTDRSRTYFVGDNPAISIRVDRSDQGDAIGI